MGAHILESNSSANLTPAVSEAGIVLPGYLVVILSALMVALVIVVVAGNALVIMAFIVDKTLRNQSNYFFLNLAISDFLVGAFCIPVYIPYNLTGRWMLGKGLCKVWLVMDYLLCSASVFNIVLISYDRFLSVTRAVSTACEDVHYRTYTHESHIGAQSVQRCHTPRQILVQGYITDFHSVSQGFYYIL
ncbi:hypothetical protein GOODEAATRI_033254 [Goodea atripinnis]|uniref:G-protein coupled receptors family 1 profile domain-containing protein n=1 Tax=Goodea atripinnis TaxID=208336 RepID=A0ABV0NZZ5_9TELE